MKLEDELKFLELVDGNDNESWWLNFWKLTDETEREFQRLLFDYKGDDVDSIFPKDFYNEMMYQIRYFNKHRVRVDGTTPWIVNYFGSIEKTMEWAINA